MDYAKFGESRTELKRDFSRHLPPNVEASKHSGKTAPNVQDETEDYGLGMEIPSPPGTPPEFDVAHIGCDVCYSYPIIII